MSQKAVQVQERLEKLIAGEQANPDGPQIDAAGLQQHIETVNTHEYQVSQAKLALSGAVEARDAAVKAARDAAVKAEYTVKAHFGPRSPKVKEYT